MFIILVVLYFVKGKSYEHSLLYIEQPSYTLKNKFSQ